MFRTSYTQGADLPDLALAWKDRNGALIDFSVAHTYELKIGYPGSTALVTKTTGFAGAATNPNLVVQWATTNELNTLVPGNYYVQIKATRTSDGKQRFAKGFIDIENPIL